MKVPAPETQEMYVFNAYGQHKHTINIHTGQYVYNFTYTVFSPYGKLKQVEDSASNKVEIMRDFQYHVNRIKSPTDEDCKLAMDNRHRLKKYVYPNNATYMFTYAVQTDLLESKQNSDGQTFLYRYDDTGRLLTVRQPTGQITSLSTDVNATGSIVRVSTGMRQEQAMSTYGSVQSVMHGKCLLS